MTPPITPSNAAMAVAASGLKAQQARMRIISENIANAESVSETAGGDPYRRQAPIFQPITLSTGVTGVGMTGVQGDQKPFHSEYNPSSPAADAKGYVKLPNVDPLVEAMDFSQAKRAYEANLNVIETARTMQSRTLDIIKK